jgi:virulence-associated protein VapD
MRSTLKKFEFRGIQGSVHVTEVEDVTNRLGAILALRALPWVPASIRDVRGFRIELWSNFTALVKS